MRRVSAPQLKRELHRAGVCVRFQSSRTLPESRTWNDYFPLSSLCAIFVLIILPELSIVNVNFVTVLFHLCEQGVPWDDEKSCLKYIDQFRGACTAPQKTKPGVCKRRASRNWKFAVFTEIQGVWVGFLLHGGWQFTVRTTWTGSPTRSGFSEHCFQKRCGYHVRSHTIWCCLCTLHSPCCC